MTISAEKFEDALVEFLHDDIIPKIPDVTIKLMLGTVVYAIRRNPGLISGYIGEHEFIRTMLCSDGYEYDADGLLDSLAEAVREYGCIEIHLPKISLISPEDKVIKLDQSDVYRLKEHMMR